MTQRPIKFRAWDEGSKRMLIVTEINFFEGYIECDELHGGSYTRLPIEGTPLLQFTGLTDANDTEIYEGDIVQEDEELTTDVIEWDGAGWATRNWFESRELMQEAPLLEVIGNIYESPELLPH